MIALGLLQVARFWSRVEIQGPHDCWPWRSTVFADSGYGRFNLADSSIGSHRVAWSLAFEQKIPKGLYVIHSCDNPPCCNPTHLRLGTPQDNMDDKMDRGRHRVLRGEAHPRTGVVVHPGEDTPTAKVTLIGVKAIVDLYKTGCYSQKELGRRFGISQTQVSRIVTGKQWRHSR